MELKEKLLQILTKEYDFRHGTLEIRKIQEGYEIKYGSMYEAPTLGFAKLMELSNLFGTTDIDVDNYSQSGCESCDYWSDYGHEIQIIRPTKLVQELQELVGKNLYE